ncbi:MAG: hypothetical protein WAV47_19280, partial [Blastocatellia bacterium]
MVLAVAGQNTLHDAANRIVLHLNQEVHVIGHQAIGVEIEGQLHFLLSENAGESEVVVVRAENLSTIITASDQVIEAPADFDPWFPRHNARDYLPRRSNVQNVASKPDPLVPLLSPKINNSLGHQHAVGMVGQAK